ncbi:prosaposin-like [Rhynchophorus ferrugineus]|uniref:prosaposin-like n=1 Tax=Rhynchophorus ferrugineus TaxID=354439 RepID=UPI003FCC8080
MKFAIVLMFVFAIFGAVFGAAPRGQLVGAEKCTWGPSYWCASRQNAVSCNALQHCETKVWGNKG